MKTVIRITAGLALAAGVCSLGYVISRSTSSNAGSEAAEQTPSALGQQRADVFTQMGRDQQLEAQNYKAQREAAAAAKFRSSPQGRALAESEANDRVAAKDSNQGTP